MTEGEALKRLGGGRWKTADDRFSVEPQSGSWVVVDAQQTDDLGLPLVRGPFASLTGARAAIQAARTTVPPVSPLAARVAEERRHPRPRKSPKAVTPVTHGRQGPPAPPPPPPEPPWISALPAARRTVARRLIDRLTEAGITGAEGIARAEVADGDPAIARAVLALRLRALLEGGPDREALATGIVGLLESGGDPQLGVRWRLVDGDDRTLAPIPWDRND